MSAKERILLCKMIEKMEKKETYSRKLGLENKSTYRGKPVETGIQR